MEVNPRIYDIITKNRNGAYMKIKGLGLLHDLIKCTNFLNDDASPSQRFWHIVNHTKIIPKCAVCDKLAAYSKLKANYSSVCCNKTCSAKYASMIASQKCFFRHGVDNYSKTNQYKEIRKLRAKPKSLLTGEDKKKSTNMAKFGVDNYSKTVEHKEFLKQLHINNVNAVLAKFKMALIEYDKRKKILTCYCHKCSKSSTISQIFYWNRSYRNHDLCIHCNPKHKSYSQWENDVISFVKSVQNNVSTNDRTVINPYELDIVMPDLKLAIECHGDYHHANPKIYKSNVKIHGRIASSIWAKDAKKSQMLENMGWKLLVVWESEYHANRPEIFHKIRSFIQDRFPLV